jgi:hypothetical protein
MSSPKWLFIAFSFCLLCALTGQPASAVVAKPPVDNDFVQQQFGATCSLVGLYPLIADFDGDGVEDIVIPAKCTNPMMNQAENNFVVQDPYNGFFGYGNPKITTQFSTEDPARRGYSLLVIHGAGPDAWRSPTPKAKYMIVNVPFKDVLLKKMALSKKKTVRAIFTEETGGDQMTSIVYWDGRRYKYQPMGSSLE